VKLTHPYILAEQIGDSVSQAYKFDIHSMGWPAKSSYIKHSRFDWKLIHSNATTCGARFCVASDGSIIVYNGTSIFRFEGPIDETTDLSSYAQSSNDVPSTYYYVKQSCLAAHPTNGEVVLFNITPDTYDEWNKHKYNYTVRYKKSTDNGVTWDANWTNLITLTDIPTFGNGSNKIFIFDITANYKTNGDVAVFWSFRLTHTNATYKSYYIFTLERDSTGTWNFGRTDFTTHPEFPSNTEPFSLSAIYDEDNETWFIVCTSYYQPDADSTPNSNTYFLLRSENFRPLYDHFWHSESHSKSCREVSIEDSTYATSNLSELSGLSNTGSSVNELWDVMSGSSSKLIEELGLKDFSITKGVFPGYTERVFKINNKNMYIDNFANVVLPGIKPFNSLIHPSGMKPIMSVWRRGTVSIYEMASDAVITDGIFKSGSGFKNDLPLQLISDGTYIYACNGNQIFRSRLPGEWVKPTAGTGAGASINIPQNKIHSIVTDTKSDEAGSAYIVCVNNTGYFDHPGSNTGGVDLTPLARFSRIDLQLGYNSLGTDYFVENSQWFIESWGYGRIPNKALFIMRCVDAWWMLDNYKFYDRVVFNTHEKGDVYCIYDIIEMAVNTIGGSLTYHSRSSDIMTIYPRIDIAPGNNLLSLVNELISHVADCIRFTGVDCEVYLPKSTDVPIYSYTGPS
jgi:hypothetical protein